MDYNIVIHDFEGPLDLLLHLIKKANIDIWEINVQEITEQYLDYIHAMEELNLDIASEYLVMAAELIELKSRMLLPNEPQENQEDEEETLTREGLIQKLLDYQQYKEILPKFKELQEERSAIYTKVQSDLREFNNGEVVLQGDVTLTNLLEAYAKFMERKAKEKPIKTKITKKEYDVKERERQIKTLLQEKKEVWFEDLFDRYEKGYVVVTFLAILEMAKEQELLLKQDYPLAKIYITLGDAV